MEVCESIQIRSLGTSSYIFVIVDDYSRLTLVIFWRNKLEALKDFLKLCKKLQISKNLSVTTIRTDLGREFHHEKFIDYYNKNDISCNFST